MAPTFDSFEVMVLVKWLASSEPSTATPTAPPTWRVVSLTAEPTPALARGSEPMIESVAGARMFAIPRPSSMLMPMTGSVELDASSVLNSSSEAGHEQRGRR